MKKLILLFLLILLTFSIFPKDRGIKYTIKKIDDNAVVGKQYLVLIGINKYKEWSSLKGPVRDTKALKKILVSQYYIDEVIELYDENATKANIIKLFCHKH